MLSQSILFVNRKGGVGKTSNVANLAALNAMAGCKTLVVDLDPQADLGLDLGYTTPGGTEGDQGRALHDAVRDRRPLRSDEVLHLAKFGLDVVPAGDFTSQLDLLLQNPEWGVTSIVDALEPLAENYDLILFDVPPSETGLQDAALVACHYVIVPTRRDSGSRQGLVRLAKRFQEVRTLNPDIELLGVALFAVGAKSTKKRREALDELRQQFEGVAPVFNTVIRQLEEGEDLRGQNKLPFERQNELLDALQLKTANAAPTSPTPTTVKPPAEKRRRGIWGSKRQVEPTTTPAPAAPAAQPTDEAFENLGIHGLAQDYANLTNEVMVQFWKRVGEWRSDHQSIIDIAAIETGQEAAAVIAIESEEITNG